ncbi:MAG: DUF1822 family protein [Drouetiella hepatica Uher 2000/2452]|jgi:hypothetical protein|uniref:DUF1822 family protein n=1 Tax=Drouetiella hepatica Uher 2000/2452 TaxID=904376 RepID=A0A951UNG5_9CYAN|nr:DUF1822 family protein [Drouetiella hepatica Uher 2000/2452]
MTYTTSSALPLPITRRAIALADQFAHRHPAEKAAQVRLNTLAVCVMNDYLQMMGIAADPSGSDSWNPVSQLCADVADLEVLGVGKLECRPLSVNSIGQTSDVCNVPPEVWEDRIGYVVVQINEAAQEASLLGFTERAIEALPLSQLRSPEALLDHLDRLMHPVTAASRVANLSQWLQNIFEEGWQTVDALLNPPNLAYGFRGIDSAASQDRSQSLRRAKLIDLNIQMPNPVALVVELTPDAEQTAICLQVHPTGTTYLPPDLRLAVLDEAGAIFLEAQSRGTDNYIQLQFSGHSGETFQVQVAIADASVIESFVI